MTALDSQRQWTSTRN